MDLSTAQWLFELEVDDPLDDLCMNEYSRSDAVPEAAKQVKINNDLSPYTASFHDQQEVSSAPSTKIISFGDLNSSPPNGTDDLHGKLKLTHEMNSSGSISWVSVDQELYGATEIAEPNKQDGTRKHKTLTEKKRRERLTDLFVYLAAIIPGLKKLDKASILAGAIEYLEQLEKRIKLLEEEKKRQHEKSVSVTSKRPRLSSTDQSFGCIPDQSSPEIEVRTCNGNIVLLRIYCKKRPEIIKDVFCAIEKLHLCIISTSVIPLGNTKLHITITAQESGEFGKAQDLVNTIRRTILKLM